MNAQGAAKYGVRLMVVLALLCAARTAGAQGQDEFFDDSTVHELRLTLNSKDWSALKQNFKENIYYPTALQGAGVNVSNVGIRSRGLGSRSGTKPGLRVDMDRYNANQTFVGLKSFVLDNLVQDPSMLRERLAMAFFRRLGLPAPREAHARLFVNGTYVGLYAIVETIDKGFLGRSFGEDGHGGPRTTATCSSTTTRASTLREPRLELRRLQNLQAQDPRERRLGEDLGADRRHGQGDQRHARRDLRTRAVHVSGSEEVRQSHRHREPSWRKTTASWATPG